MPLITANNRRDHFQLMFKDNNADNDWNARKKLQ